MFNGISTRIKQWLLWMSAGRAPALHRMRKEKEGMVSQLFRLVKANGKKLWSTAMGVQLRHDGYTAHAHTSPHYTSTHSVQGAAVLCQMS